MLAGDDKQLTLDDAAEIIYCTKNPDCLQVARIRQKLQPGELKGKRGKGDGQWRTSTTAVAEFMARQSIHNTRTKRIDHRSPAEVAAGAVSQAKKVQTWRASEGMTKVYQEVLEDYFLAVIRRRNIKHHSIAFARSVLVGQVALLAFTVALLAGAVRLGIVPPPPERLLVENFIAGQAKSFKITERLPSQPDGGGGTFVRVRYRYFSESGKPVDTERLFLVKNKSVSHVTSD